MSKIVTAVNAMLSNPSLITNSTQGEMDNECFFKYDGKHLWSIINLSNGRGYALHYYPGEDSLESMAAIPEELWEDANIKTVEYQTKTLGTKEAKDSFEELNSIVREKVYGMEDVLNEIIGNGQF